MPGGRHGGNPHHDPATGRFVRNIDAEIAASRPRRFASNFAAAREHAKAFQGRDLTNQATGMVARVSRNNLDKMLSAKAVGKSETPQTHAFAVANLDDLFERAILGWNKPDRDGDPNIKAIHRFFTIISIDGRVKLVKLTVKERRVVGGKNPLYTVEAVEPNEKMPGREWIESAAMEDGVSLRGGEPPQRGVGRRDSQHADPKTTLARLRGVTPSRSAEDVLTIAQAVESFNANMHKSYAPVAATQRTDFGGEYARLMGKLHVLSERTEASERKILAAAEAREAVVIKRMQTVKPLVLTKSGASREYQTLVLERRRLAMVIESARATLDNAHAGVAQP